jgi:uncharacterized protein (TIGR00255 family)
MTGHGAARCQQDGVAIAIDLRTVNSRYYKLSVRANESSSALEPLIDEFVRQRVRRGTIQLELRIERESTVADYRLDEAVLTAYWNQLAALRQQLKCPPPDGLDALLTLPGVVREHTHTGEDMTEIWPLIQATLAAALENMDQMRAEEGQAMAADLLENLRTIRGELDYIADHAGGVADAYRARLTERINKLLVEHDIQVQPSDVIREVGLFAERSDISEELVRLRSHLEQFQAIMELPESNGRKLEFITQEMFREANTIGSKANSAQITGHVVEIKSAIERIREMIQNIE